MEKGPARLPCDEKDDEEIPRRPLVTFVRYQDEVSGGGVCTWGGGGELWAAPQSANAAVVATPSASTTIRAATSLSIGPLLSLAFVTFCGAFRHAPKISCRRHRPNAHHMLGRVT